MNLLLKGNHENIIKLIEKNILFRAGKRMLKNTWDLSSMDYMKKCWPSRNFSLHIMKVSGFFFFIANYSFQILFLCGDSGMQSNAWSRCQARDRMPCFRGLGHKQILFS